MLHVYKKGLGSTTEYCQCRIVIDSSLTKVFKASDHDDACLISLRGLTLATLLRSA